MAKIIRLVDISPVIYTGSVIQSAEITGDIYVSPTTGERKLEYIKTGGIMYLFNILRDYLYNSTIIFCADREATVRKKINPNYKAKRGNNPNQFEIDLQRRMVEKILTDCNLNVVYCEDWESDDCLYTLSKLLYTSCDRMYIHTSDKDLAMCVNDKVSLAPVRKKDQGVTLETYEYTAGKKGTYVEYNTCNFLKMLEGDPGDGYGKIQDADVTRRLISTFGKGASFRPYTGDSKVFGQFIQNLIPEAYDQFILAYQQMVPVSFDLGLVPDRLRVEFWGRLVGNSAFTDVRAMPELKDYIPEANEYLRSLFRRE